ncbi:uncharacterized protein FA14DRAFT_159114 [Meira miltonrushii]|uniref:Mitochondrial distribution and morphology protein 34 n=1 Tax=Meira miltonrushii TaxID=1280837 RepID=A0A316VGR8_9BASI|nr:uncharacterized protein FA14DRAFT_159114 [Meira miltonrushii]PWN36710.1 hypothetical protein FA14DRAFT_159114 [Meira miltonrushii]
MSFNFSWPKFSRQFHADAAKMLDGALNRGPKPKVIADDIKVEDINMGTIPPELEILEIGELSSERLRGIFRLTYTGDAHLLLSTKVQANPLTRPNPSGSASPFEDVSSAFPSSTTSRGILFAARPLVVPMQLRLSSMRLKAIIVLVVSKQKGITLVFKNDPLESVEVSSTFDSVAVIQKYLQQEIEGQLREMFREDLPGIIHRLSQTWLSGRKRKSSNTATTAPMRPVESDTFQQPRDTLPTDNAESQSISIPSRKARSTASAPRSKQAKSPARKRKTEKAATTATATPPSSPPLRNSTFNTPRAPSRSFSSSAAGKAQSTKATSPSISPVDRFSTSPTGRKGRGQSYADLSQSTSIGSLSGFHSGYAHDVENYDPTYGLRPDEIRISANRSNFSGLAQLARQETRGLGDFASLSLSGDKGKDKVSKPTSPPPIRSPTHRPDFEQSSDDEAVQQTDEEEEDIDEVRGYPDHEWNEFDDVPDYPDNHQDSAILESSDADQDSESDDDVEDLTQESEDEVGNFSRFGYPPASADFSNSAVEESARQSSSLFTPSSNLSVSPRKPSSSRMSASGSRSRSSTSGAGKTSRPPLVEYETIPAVGGGTFVRPRIYHNASRLQAPDVEEEDDLASSRMVGSTAASSTARGPASSHTYTIRPDGEEVDDRDEVPQFMQESDDYTDESPSAAGHESLVTLDPDEMDPSSIAYRTQLYRQQYGRMYRPGYGRQLSISSNEFSSSGASSRHPSYSPDEDMTARQRAWTPASRASTAPTSSHPSTHSTRPSSTSLAVSSGDGPSKPGQAPSHRNPSLSASNSSNAMTMDASHHFMDLVNSNHTLSPFTRTLDTKGFAVRSHPVTPTSPSVVSGSTTGSGNVRPGMVRGNTAISQPQGRLNASMRTQSFDTRSLDGRSGGGRSVSGTSSPSIAGSAPVAGRRRTFKLAGSNKSTDNTPTRTPTIPASEDGFSNSPSQRIGNRSSPSIASTEQESGSMYDGLDRQSSRAGMPHNPRSLSYNGNVPVRRAPAPVRRGASFNNDQPRRKRFGNHSGLANEIQTHNDTFNRMGSIRE